MNLLVTTILTGGFSSNYVFSEHSIPKLQNIIFYFLITDALYYWVHRIIHRTPILKNMFHLEHHEAIHLLPLDIYYTGYKETLLFILIIHMVPLLFIHLNLIEYLIILFILSYHSYYTHADIKDKFILPLFISSNYHKKHHTIGGGNYSLFLNIWDEYMGTKIKSKSKNKSKSKKESLK
jgi:sterol desaturase/sphingolipid hydroxylase (fatty acid hydroxylase superfamily)